MNLQGLSMKEQNEQLDAELDKWMTGFEQVDDITVMGVKV
jgi:hypothetical protein